MLLPRSGHTSKVLLHKTRNRKVCEQMYIVSPGITLPRPQETFLPFFLSPYYYMYTKPCLWNSLFSGVQVLPARPSLGPLPKALGFNPESHFALRRLELYQGSKPNDVSHNHRCWSNSGSRPKQRASRTSESAF